MKKDNIVHMSSDEVDTLPRTKAGDWVLKCQIPCSAFSATLLTVSMPTTRGSAMPPPKAFLPASTTTLVGIRMT